MLGKHVAPGKAIKALTDKHTDENSTSDEERNRRRKKARLPSSSNGSTKPPGASSGSHKATCFLCGLRWHRSSECRVPREKRVSLHVLPDELHNSIKAVRGMIKKDPGEI